jgi:hypothetical protein
MSRYPQGQPVYLPFTVTDNTQTPPVPVDGGALTLTVQKPDLTSQTYTPTHDGAAGSGLYHQIIPVADLSQLGQHKWKLVITGAGAGVAYGIFDVFDPFEVTVLSLSDAKSMLNDVATDTTDDAEIQRKIAAIEAGIENVIGGPVITRTISNERLEVGSGYRTFALRYRPVVSVMSIVDVASGVAMSLADIDLDPVTGIVRRKLNLPFWSRGPFYLITYTAGLGTAVPQAIAEAAAVILKHLWSTQRGNALTVPTGGEQMTTVPGMGFMVPNLAAELLAPYAQEVYV